MIEYLLEKSLEYSPSLNSAYGISTLLTYVKLLISSYLHKVLVKDLALKGNVLLLLFDIAPIQSQSSVMYFFPLPEKWKHTRLWNGQELW